MNILLDEIDKKNYHFEIAQIVKPKTLYIVTLYNIFGETFSKVMSKPK